MVSCLYHGLGHMSCSRRSVAILNFLKVVHIYGTLDVRYMVFYFEESLYCFLR